MQCQFYQNYCNFLKALIKSFYRFSVEMFVLLKVDIPLIRLVPNENYSVVALYFLQSFEKS